MMNPLFLDRKVHRKVRMRRRKLKEPGLWARDPKSGAIEMKKWSTAFFVSLVIVSPAWADSLTISGSGVNWNTNNPSPTFTVQIANPTGSAVSLYSWQLGLVIAPESGASGSVQFATTAIPGTDYVMAGNSSGLSPSLSLPSTSIPIVSDSTPSNVGSSLPANSTFNLLDLTFSASSGAKGIFDVYAVPLNALGTAGSGWYGADFNPQSFANVPSTGGNVLLGDVVLFQPQGGVAEPSSIVLLIAGCAGLLAARQVRRVRAA